MLTTETSYSRKKKAYFKLVDSKVFEDKWTSDRVYIRLDDILTREVREAIADYSLCSQWD